MKATLSWLSTQPLAIKTTEEGGGWEVSLAHHVGTEVNFQLSSAVGEEFELPP